jgi:hypothetical protein
MKQPEVTLTDSGTVIDGESSSENAPFSSRGNLEFAQNVTDASEAHD